MPNLGKKGTTDLLNGIGELQNVDSWAKWQVARSLSSCPEPIRYCSTKGLNVPDLPTEGVVIKRRAYERGEVKVRVEGLLHCDRHACPHCRARWIWRRSQQIVPIFEAWGAGGGTIAHVALTIRHNRKHSLKQLLDVLKAAWRRFTLRALKGREGRLADVKELSGLSWLRVLQVTRGESNGWHPHYHVVFFVPKGIEINTESIKERLMETWIDAVGFVTRENSALYRKYGDIGASVSPAAPHAVEVTEHGRSDEMPAEGLAWYVLGAMELLRDDLKDGGLDPLSLLDNDSTSYLWAEYARVIDGARLVQWGGRPSARKAVEAQIDKREFELKEEAPIAVEEVRVEPRAWHWLTRNVGIDRISLFLAAVRTSIETGVEWWCDNAPVDLRYKIALGPEINQRGRRVYVVHDTVSRPATAAESVACELHRLRAMAPLRVDKKIKVIKVNRSIGIDTRRVRGIRAAGRFSRIPRRLEITTALASIVEIEQEESEMDSWLVSAA